MGKKAVFDIAKLAYFYGDIYVIMNQLNDQLIGFEEMTNDKIGKIIFNFIKGNKDIIKIFDDYEERFPDCPALDGIHDLKAKVVKLENCVYSEQVWEFCSFLIDLFGEVRKFSYEFYGKLKEMGYED